jgi:hypothetical protein
VINEDDNDDDDDDDDIGNDACIRLRIINVQFNTCI